MTSKSRAGARNAKTKPHSRSWLVKGLLSPADSGFNGVCQSRLCRKIMRRDLNLPSEQSRSPVGILAGWGSFPVEVAKVLREQGMPTCIVCLKGHASSELASIGDQFEWRGVLKLGAQLRFFQRRGVDRVVFAGKIFKDRILYHGRGWIDHMPDLFCYRVLGSSFVLHRRDGRDDTVLGAVVRAYAKRGIKVLPINEVAPGLLVEPGLISRRVLSRNGWRDAQFAWDIAQRMGDLDIGQSITVRDQIVLGVEAIEGTDALIARTGRLCPKGGFTLIKVAKPNQDMRFDVPTIGRQTVEQMARAGGGSIVVEAGRTILVDRDETLALADKHGISIVAMENASASNAGDGGKLSAA